MFDVVCLVYVRGIAKSKRFLVVEKTERLAMRKICEEFDNVDIVSCEHVSEHDVYELR